MNRKRFILLFALVFCASAAFAQGRGGGGGGAARGGGAPGGGIGGGPVGGASVPSNQGTPQSGRPSNAGKPDSTSSTGQDHRADAAATHAVDPKDTHGFKNYGQYVAANEVSEHLGIPLADLKASMDAEGGNLGKAIHTLRPGLSSKEVEAQVKKAEAAARKAQAEANKKSTK